MSKAEWMAQKNASQRAGWDSCVTMDGSARSYDKDGRLHIARSHIAKAGVNPYYGREIPGSDALGLDPDRVYQLFRDPEELKKAAHTFQRLPILKQHQPINAAQHPQELVVGAIGSDVEFNDPYLDADTSFWNNESIAGIESGSLREFSPAYHYVPVMIPGEYKGQSYDGRMTQIHGNHLCTVEAGRNGPDVLAADSILEELTPMKKTKFGTLLIAALGAASPKLAQDASFAPLLSELTPAKLKIERKAITGKLIAMDAECKDKVDAVMDAAAEVDEEDPQALAEDEDDETEEERKAREAKEKKDKDDAKTAMDAAIAQVRIELRSELAQDARNRDEALRLVRPVVGDVIAQDSAEEILTFALDEMKVDHAGVSGYTAKRALFNAAHKGVEPAPRVAMDSAGLATRFPNAMRFRAA